MDNSLQQIKEKFLNGNFFDCEEFVYLIENSTENIFEKEGRECSRKKFGNQIYIRGLIEFTNHCRNNCFYCGIRGENKKAVRYRLTKEQIMDCAAQGYELGYRTFVLQGGEDFSYSDEDIAELVAGLKNKFPDCAVTLSVGERTKAVYRLWKDCGADRYLLRHETADNEHYRKLHPENMSLENRKQCLYDLKELGYQTGAGFMVGSPYQSGETLYKDLLFLKELQPEMIGIGPFIHHNDTPFGKFRDGSLPLTLLLISVLRLMFPDALIPATTALATLDGEGRKKGILSGANVIMPNLSPADARKKYLLYENKKAFNEESAESKLLIEKELESIGYRMIVSRGDFCE